MLGLAWFVYGYFGLISSCLPPLLTQIERDLHLDSVQAGLLLGAWPLVFVAGALVGGRINDGLGLKRSILIGVTFVALSAFLRGLANSFITMFGAVAIFGLGGSIISTGMPKVVAQWFTGKARTRASGIYITGPALGGAFALGATNSLVMPAVHENWHTVFFIYAAGGLVAFAAWFLFGRDGPAAQPGQAVQPEPVGRVLRMWPVWLVVFVGLAGFTMSSGFRGWLPAILESKGYSHSQAGWIASISSFVGIFGSLAILEIATRTGRKPALVVMLGIIGACMAVVIATRGSVMVASLMLQGLCAGAVIPLLMSLLMDLPELTPATVGTAAGIFFTIGQAGAFTSPVFIGALKGSFNSFTPGLALLVAVSFLAILPALSLREESRKQAAQALQPVQVEETAPA
jgi:cyanate permease